MTTLNIDSAKRWPCWAVLLCLLAGRLSAASVDFAQEISTNSSASAITTAQSLLNRIVIVGASASAGFTVSEPFGGTNTEWLTLSRYLDAALVWPHQPISNLANALFFLRPETFGRGQIELAKRTNPTLVVGADFLFWYCYGEVPKETDRRMRFESGLELLNQLSVPLVIGDIPDASAAAGGMLSPAQIPTPETISAANRRLNEWVATRKEVRVLSLSGFMRAAMADRGITIGDYTLPDGQTRSLLQNDKLHPTAQGAATLALAILDSLPVTQSPRNSSDIRWDPKLLIERVRSSVTVAR